MRRLIRLLLAGWLVSSAAFASAGELFASPEPLAVQIRGSLSALARDTDEVRRWHAAQLTHEGMDYRIRLRARGNFRRATCRFPPLMLDFRETKRRPRRHVVRRPESAEVGQPMRTPGSQRD